MGKAIIISDNCFAGESCKQLGATKNDIKNLSSISDISLADLIKRQKTDNKQDLLVFPQSIGDNGDGLGEESICSLSTIGGDSILKTSNVMGYVSVNDTKLRINSRFDNSNKEFFLLYMLTKVMSINIFSWKYSDSNQMNNLDFRMFMFAHFLHKAILQGVFKTYKRFQYNDANVKGVIDVPRHVRINNPFSGKIAYNCRQHDFDNPMTQLIRHTIEYIRTKKMGRMILNSKDVINDITLIESLTGTYSLNDRRRVIVQNLRPLVHPYFTEYSFLQKLCLQILNDDPLSFGESKNDCVNGVLFDGAWLWEEYLNTILKNMGFSHPQNKEGTGGVSLFGEDSPISHNLFPDFYNSSEKIVLDAKYKRFDERLTNKTGWDEGIRADVFQVVTYMHIQGFKTGCFAYPCKEKKEQVSYPLSVDGEKISTIPFCVPDSSDCDWKSFCDKMHSEEESFKNRISELTS